MLSLEILHNKQSTISKIKTYLKNNTADSAPLAVFRIFFGILMFISIVRFWLNGWIKTLYIDPEFHFTYYGFGWITDFGEYTYILFFICGLSSLMISLGYKYRVSIIIFFLSFTYIELIDKTTYLNHYYFVSSISFLMCFLPLNCYYSLDSYFSKKSYKKANKWTIDSIKLMLCIVYFYAGFAKINSEWLLKAMPLSIWLPSKYDIPLIGQNLMQEQWVHYFMSWGGMFYDLLIPFLLIYKRTRILAFALVVFFHLFTKILFPIGMFPYIMIVASSIFFESKIHQNILNKISDIINYLTSLFSYELIKTVKLISNPIKNKQHSLTIVIIFFIFQILFPLRYSMYPGELFWNEEGYRFSWRVMLIEKRGYSNFKIVDSITKKYFYVQNDDFLTSYQEKQMSFQPDFILQYAHYLGNHFKSQGHENLQVFVDSHVALNGRSSSKFINSEVDLYKQKESFKHKTWIIPFNDEIKGF
tara:strand:+ start:2726 stop:4144 length:1419 start_codon:yes stop_codon:yes gene_type:complete